MADDPKQLKNAFEALAKQIEALTEINKKLLQDTVAANKKVADSQAKTNKNLDYISNTLPIKESKFPNGSDIEIFKAKLFQKYQSLTKKDKEHVTNVFWQDKRLCGYHA